MGLCLTNGQSKINWTYSHFNKFRNKLANHIGIYDLHSCEIDDECPFKHLLTHSDYSGNITPDQCQMMILFIPFIIEVTQDVEFKQDLTDLHDLIVESILINKNIDFC